MAQTPERPGEIQTNRSAMTVAVIGAGAVVRRGRDAGIPTPVMATLYGILKPFEHGAPGAASGA